MTLHVVIAGKPIPKGRPRFGAGHAFTPKATVAYEKHAKACMCAAALAAKWETLRGDVDVRVLLVYPNRTHGDIDNCAKAILDAANGVAFGDDKQIAALSVRREYDKASPRAEMWVTAVEVTA